MEAAQADMRLTGRFIMKSSSNSVDGRLCIWKGFVRLVVLVSVFLCWLGRSLPAQSCTNGEGGAPSSLESKCIPLLVSTASNVNSRVSGGGPSTPREQIPPGAESSLPPGSPTSGGGSGSGGDRGDTVHLASGELRYLIPLVSLGGIVPEAEVGIFARHRSHFAYPPSGGTPDVDATGNLPFGEGWLASWGDRIYAVGGPGGEVRHYDASGLVTIFTNIEYQQTIEVPLEDNPVTEYSYSAQKGWRLIWAYVPVAQGSQAVEGRWFREFPDRTRIAYEHQNGDYWRIKKIYRGEDYWSPQWEVVYDYGQTNYLQTITDSRGYELSFLWQPWGSGNHQRVSRLSLSHPQITGVTWSKYNIDFTYDTEARLLTTTYPETSYLYDANGDGDYDDTEDELTARRGIRIQYVGTGDARISNVYQRISPTQEIHWLSMSYRSIPDHYWQVAAQTLRPNSTWARTWTFTYPSAYRMTWTDPKLIGHEVDHQENSTTPLEWFPTRYRRDARSENPRTTDGNYPLYTYDWLEWTFEWDTCGCGRLRRMTLPSGIEGAWSYDTQNRGLLVAYDITGADQTTRTWTWSYEPWGSPWQGGDTFAKASRLTSYQGEATVDHWSFTFDPSTLKTVIASPDLTYEVEEDALGRVVVSRDPVFTAEDSSTTDNSRAPVRLTYGTDAQSGSYGLITKITEYVDFSQSQLAETALARDELGRVVKVTDEEGEEVEAQLDNFGRITKITLPEATTPFGSYDATIDLTWSVHGRVGRVERSANDVYGAAYGKSKLTSELVTNGLGEPWIQRVDSGAMDSSSTDWRTTSYTYDELGRLVAVDAPGGRRTEYVIDDYDLIFKARKKLNDTEWAERVFCYTKDGQHALATDATGLTTQWEYDEFGRVSKTTFPGDEKEIRYTYDDRDLVTLAKWYFQSSPMSQVAIAYDDEGRIQTRTLTDLVTNKSSWVSYTWNGLLPYSISDDQSRETKRHHDPRGLVRRVEDQLDSGATNQVVVTERDLVGRVTTLDRILQEETSLGTYTAQTYRTEFEHDEWGRVTDVVRYGRDLENPAMPRLIGYDSLGRVTWERDSVEKVRTATHDGLGRTLASTLVARGAQDSVTISYAYDDDPAQAALGLIVTMTDARQNDTIYHLDKGGRTVARFLPGYTSGTSFSWTYAYDEEGRLESWRDGRNLTVTLARDDEGRVVHRGPTYDQDALDGLSLMATFEEWTYDDEDRKVTSKTWRGDWYQGLGAEVQLIQETVSVDGLGRLLQEDFGFADNGLHQPANTKTLQHGYDLGGGSEDTGFRRQLDLSSGWEFEFTPDAMGKLKGVDVKAPGAPGFSNLADYRYEGGRVASRDIWTSAATQPKLSTSFATNDLGYLTQLTTDLDTGSGPSTIFSLTRTVDVEGNVQAEQYAKINGAGDRYLLDGFDRILESKLGVPSGQFGGDFSQADYDRYLEYAIDLAQNVTSVTETVFGQQPNTTNYTVETDSNRYTQAGADTIVYDGNGNLISDGHYVYVYDYLDRLSEVYELYIPDGLTSFSSTSTLTGLGRSNRQNYDRCGRYLTQGVALTERQIHEKVEANRARRAGDLYVASPATQTSSATSSAGGGELPPVPVLIALYGYDSHNRRIGKTTMAGITWHTYDGWQVAEEWDTSFTPRKVYFDGIGIDEHLGYATYDPQTQAWTRYAIVQNALGSVMQVRNEDGSLAERYEYGLYGDRRAYNASSVYIGTVSIVGNVYGYTGRRHDEESGLLYYRNRYYAGALRRFLTYDPLGTYFDLPNWGNGYAYVGGSPNKSKDSYGLYVVGPGAAGEHAALIHLFSGGPAQDETTCSPGHHYVPAELVFGRRAKGFDEEAASIFDQATTGNTTTSRHQNHNKYTNAVEDLMEQHKTAIGRDFDSWTADDANDFLEKVFSDTGTAGEYLDAEEAKLLGNNKNTAPRSRFRAGKWSRLVPKSLPFSKWLATYWARTIRVAGKCAPVVGTGLVIFQIASSSDPPREAVKVGLATYLSALAYAAATYATGGSILLPFLAGGATGLGTEALLEGVVPPTPPARAHKPSTMDMVSEDGFVRIMNVGSKSP